MEVCPFLFQQASIAEKADAIPDLPDTDANAARWCTGTSCLREGFFGGKGVIMKRALGDFYRWCCLIRSYGIARSGETLDLASS